MSILCFLGGPGLLPDPVGSYLGSLGRQENLVRGKGGGYFLVSHLESMSNRQSNLVRLGG